MLSIQVFAIKFADSESALEFKDKFKQGQDEMTQLLSGKDAAAGDAEATKAAEALSSLEVKSGDDSEKKDTA
jgi:hypothetical protein